MTDERVLKQVMLAGVFQPTGNTRHYVFGELVTTFYELRIVDLNGNIYLYYCDETGAEVSDTWHASVEDAMRQAEFEFKVRPGDWQDLKAI